MEITPADYYPIELIFNLLCVLRARRASTLRAARRAVQQRGLRSLENTPGEAGALRLSFWLQLCQVGGLLDNAPIPHPTLLAPDWLRWPLLDQLDYLLTAWRQMPQTIHERRRRETALERMQTGADLSARQRRELTGLQLLRMWTGHHLTRLGAALLHKRRRSAPVEIPDSLPWQLQGDGIRIPFPPDWVLLWELEKYLRLSAPGLYLLPNSNAYPSEAFGSNFTTLLEAGFGGVLPSGLVNWPETEPQITFISGPVLEFNRPADLLRMRRSRRLGQFLERILSPRHATIRPADLPEFMRSLQRSGQYDPIPPEIICQMDRMNIHGLEDQENGILSLGSSALLAADRAYLLSLLRLAEKLPGVTPPPPDLAEKLETGLVPGLRRSAASQAEQNLQSLLPKPSVSLDLALPPSTPEIIAYIQQAIDRSESIDVIYQSATDTSPQPRHLTPLVLETRGVHTYLIAYCHTRRADRTFRLDRLKIAGFPAGPVSKGSDE